MAYTVLARKYRSRTFEEVIGQGPIATTLVNAIKAGRIHHGYLFTGTRGVGKTSMARILAKALNCLRFDEPTATPCCECDACTAIAEGQDIDVIEIDAASNTGVDNIRELRSNTAYRPARSRYKVYIIDEVHMLSTGAFNALLKTLEEPPEHVKFILATTEIQKVPATIQSRCQRFNFRNIGPDEIAGRLAEIVESEGARAEEAVVRRVARLANGSMRDALSILDQLLSISPGELTAEVLDEVLPPTQSEQVLGLLEHAAAGDVAAVLADTDAILASGRGIEVFCSDLIEVARTLMHVRACGVDARIVDVPAAAREQVQALAERFELSHYVQMIAMVEELRRRVRLSGAGRALTDALMVRLAHMREWASVEQLLARLSADGEKKKPATERGRSVASSGGSSAPLAQPPSAPAACSSTTQDVATATPPNAGRRPVPGGSMSHREREAPDGSAAETTTPISAHANPPEGTGTGDDADRGVEEPAAVSVSSRVVGRLPVSAEQRKRILDDPLVQQVLELFDGAVVNLEREAPAAAIENSEDAE